MMQALRGSNALLMHSLTGQMSGSYQCQSTNAVRLTLGEWSVIQTLLLTDPSCQLLSQRVI